VGADGKTIPRNLVHRLTCAYNGTQVFEAELFAAVAANPYCVFHTVATASGSLQFTWEGDHGFRQTETVTITVA
jgi:sulfur-oxidizing protein SoxZ